MSFFEELKRRNVFRVAIAYIVVAWLVLQVADVVLNNIEAPDWVFQVIMLLLGLGFPIVLVFAWAFEMTPEGLKRDHEVDRNQSITGETGKKINGLIIGALVVALGYFAYDKFFVSAERETALIEAATLAAKEQSEAAGEKEIGHSIAVLPFADMSPDQDQEYFTDGLSEELLNLLARIPELKVAARTSSFQFKGQTGDITEIGKQLKVANILEGSVRKAGNQIRITAQLVKIEDGYHLWSETWDRTLDDVFAIQDEISAAVAEALKITLLGEAPHAVETNPEAYALYLQGKFLFNQRTAEAWLKSEEAFKKSIEIDSGYAAAWAGLSEVQQYRAGFGQIDLEKGMTDALRSVEKALELDPELGISWANLGVIHSNYEWDYEAADNAIKKALALEPNNASVLYKAGDQARFTGRFEEAEKHYRKAIILDPVNTFAYGALQGTLISQNSIEEAEEFARAVINLNPQASSAHANLGLILMDKGQLEEALAEVELETNEIWRAYGLFHVYHLMGNKTQADVVLEQFIAQHHEAWAYQVADLYAFSGEADLAFEWLERARQQRDPGYAWTLSDTSLRSLHDDPRWEPLLEQVGLLNAWREMPDEYKGFPE